MRYLVTDIETGPNDRLSNYISTVDLKPAKNLKDEAKIEKNLKEKRFKIESQAALHWWTGRVVCICSQPTSPTDIVTFFNKNEKDLLIDFGMFLTIESKNHTLIAKNIEFDRPFLIGRYIAHDLGIPDILRTHHLDRTIDDVDKIFSFRRSQCSQITTLQNYAFGMMIEGKFADSSTMSNLFMAWMMGDSNAITTIVKHCKRDVEITTELLRRSLKQFTVETSNSIDPKEIPF